MFPGVTAPPLSNSKILVSVPSVRVTVLESVGWADSAT
jgi:hypothetical protein